MTQEDKVVRLARMQLTAFGIDLDVGLPEANYQYLLAMDIGEPCTCVDCAVRGDNPVLAQNLPYADSKYSLLRQSHFFPNSVVDDDYRDRRLTEFSPL